MAARLNESQRIVTQFSKTAVPPISKSARWLRVGETRDTADLEVSAATKAVEPSVAARHKTPL